MARPDASVARTRQILGAAAVVFARVGLHQARVEDIAAEAGLSKGLVYRYFANKDALIVALIDDFYGEALARLQAVGGAEGPAIGHLARVVDHLGATVERLAPLLPVAFEFYAAALRRPDVGRLLRRYYADYHAVVGAAIERGIERGEFRARSADEAADALIALFEGATVLWAVERGGASWTERAWAALAVALDGLRVEGDAPRQLDDESEGAATQR